MGVAVVNWTVNAAQRRRCARREGVDEAEAKDRERPLVEHPEWIRVREKIMVALGPFVEARKALELALMPERPRADRDW
jgi:hypothetical protein